MDAVSFCVALCPPTPSTRVYLVPSSLVGDFAFRSLTCRIHLVLYPTRSRRALAPINVFAYSCLAPAMNHIRSGACKPPLSAPPRICHFVPRRERTTAKNIGPSV